VVSRSARFVGFGPVLVRGTEIVLRDVGSSLDGTVADGGAWLEVWDPSKRAWVETTEFDRDDMLEGRSLTASELSARGIPTDLPDARTLL